MPSIRLFRFIKSTPLVPVTGGDICMLQWMDDLIRLYDWEVEAYSYCNSSLIDSFRSLVLTLGYSISPGSQKFSYTYGSVRVHICYEEDRALMTTAADDIPSEAWYQSVSELDRPAVFGINCRDFSALRSLKNRQPVGFLSECASPARVLTEEDNRECMTAIQGLKHVFVPARFLQSFVAETWGVLGARVVLNPFPPERYAPCLEPEDCFITLFNPTTAKGLDVAIELARELPERKFQFAGGFGAEHRSRLDDYRGLPNVRSVSFQGDPSPVYRTSRVVIVPSLCPDVFPRVIMEAQSIGAVVIAADVGGIREAGGDAALYIPVTRSSPYVWAKSELRDWIEALQQLEEPSFFGLMRQRGFERAARYQHEYSSSFREFELVLRGCLAQ